MFMGEWQHKERSWNHSKNYEDIEGNRLNRKSGMKGKPFTDWLDWQCEGGWKVFKISRDFNHGNGTWCIFRRLV